MDCPVCATCEQSLPSLPHCCVQCARFLVENEGDRTNNGLKNSNSVCGTCLHHPPPYARTHALFPYESPIIQLITQLKFQFQLYHAEALGSMMAKRLPHWYDTTPLPDLILPVPLHPLRLRERGFNQAIEIAKPIRRLYRLPLDVTHVRRIKHTAAQSGLNASERRHNLAHAFATERDYTGLSIAVLDDVVTTGQTMQELCRLLHERGARRIDVWCCARRG